MRHCGPYRRLSLSHARRIAGVVAACAGLWGCRGEAELNPKRFIPPSATARAALSTALESWRAGRPSGRIESKRQPAQIQYVDSLRKPDQRLRGFAILGEVPHDDYRCFKVRLDLDPPPLEDQPPVRYFVFGINPIWVYRAEELEMITHWDHHPTEDSETPATQPKAESPGHEHSGQERSNAVKESTKNGKDSKGGKPTTPGEIYPLPPCEGGLGWGVAWPSVCAFARCSTREQTGRSDQRAGLLATRLPDAVAHYHALGHD
jgi:hypothetical protein